MRAWRCASSGGPPCSSCAWCSATILAAALSSRAARCASSACVPLRSLLALAGQLDAVDGEHGATDQAQAVAGHEHLCKQRLDVGAEFANELGDVGVARACVAGQGHEQHVVLTGLLDLAAGDEASAVGQQHDLEHDARVVGRRAGDVVAELGIQRREVEFNIHQVGQCELEGAGLDLLFEHHRDEQAVALDRLVAGHLADLSSLRCEFNALRSAPVVSAIPDAGSSSYCTVSTFELSGAVRRPLERMVRPHSM